MNAKPIRWTVCLLALCACLPLLGCQSNTPDRQSWSAQRSADAAAEQHQAITVVDLFKQTLDTDLADPLLRSYLPTLAEPIATSLRSYTASLPNDATGILVLGSVTGPNGEVPAETLKSAGYTALFENLQKQAGVETRWFIATDPSDMESIREQTQMKPGRVATIRGREVCFHPQALYVFDLRIDCELDDRLLQVEVGFFPRLAHLASGTSVNRVMPEAATFYFQPFAKTLLTEAEEKRRRAAER